MQAPQTPFSTPQKSLRELSPIAAEARRLRGVLEQSPFQQSRDALLRESIDRRRKLLDELRSAGLEVSSVQYPGDDAAREKSHEDLSLRDDGGKLLETLVRIPVFTADQLEKVYQIADKYRLGVMSVGARTSALGVFSAWEAARMHGLEGVLCVDLPACWLTGQGSGDMKKKGMPPVRLDEKGQEQALNRPVDLLDVPELASGEECLVSDELPLAVIKHPEGLHRVIAHATVTVSQVNAFIQEVLPSDEYHYQILPDLTSKEQAALGGVIATGAQGGNRASARVDLLRCTVLDGLGKRVLEGEDAKNIVGYNGYLGTCVQAEFEITPFPKYSFGVLLPIRGLTTEEMWDNMMKFQGLVSPHCFHPSKLSEQSAGRDQSFVTGLEILGRDSLEMGIEKHGGRVEELKVLLERFPEARAFIYVTGATKLGSDGELDFASLLQDPLFSGTLGTNTDTDDLEEAFDGDFLVMKDPEQKPHVGVYPLMDAGLLKEVDAVRHSAPEVARAEAEKLGNVTQSTDFNIQFTGDEESQQRARAKVAALFAKYQSAFEAGPYRVDVYGHLYPGMVESPKGGGMDPHVRISLKLSDPDTRNDSPERVNEMKSLQGTFYNELLALAGVDGMVVAPPEKSHLTNDKYVAWERLVHPAKVLRLDRRVLAQYSVEDRRKRLLAGFRVPLELPSEPGRGMKSFFSASLLPSGDRASDLNAYADAVMELSQLSHRGPEIKAMLREVVVSLREALKLHPFRQHPLYIESVEEGRMIIERNLGPDHGYEIVEVSDAVDFETIDETTFDPKKFYLIPAESLGGIPGLCIMITPHGAVQKADKRKKQGLNKEVFRNLSEMFHLYPYQTSETPNIPAIAYLGLALQKDDLADQSGVTVPRVLTVNPGPTQLHQHVRSVAKKQGFVESVTVEEQQADVDAFRKFLRMPEEIRLGFTGSATQCMQHLGEALARHLHQVRLIQVVNGAFSERMNKILKSHGLPVSTLKTPWTTAEQSQVEFVSNELGRMMKEAKEEGKKPVLFVTPHKTSTTADFHPDVLIHQLAYRGFQMGKDYELVCDVTSGLGAIDYFTESTRAGGMSFFGSVQKALGCPAGMGVFGLSEGLSGLLLSEDGPTGLKSAVDRTESGTVHNRFGLRMLGEKSRYELEKGRDVSKVHEETRQKLHTVLGFMALHPALCMQVPSAEDQSPLLVGMYSLLCNLSVAGRLMKEIFGYHIGAGYGPYANESIRVYLPTIDTSDLDQLLTALHAVLQLPEVTQTVNQKAPLVSLREPHDPLQVLKHLVTSEVRPDDIFVNGLGLGWIRRLQYTLELGGHTTYGSSENLDEIRRILTTSLKNRRSLLESYTILEAKIDRIRDILLEGDQISLGTVDALISDMYRDLGEIVLILEKYAKDAPRLEDGRIKWPLAATQEQLKNGNGKH
ncbi:MAG: hypothetical protein AB7J40_01790 [Candidatus Altimarinota bacterium]